MTGLQGRRHQANATRVVVFPERKCPMCGRALHVVVGTEELPTDPLFCVIHGQVGVRREPIINPGRFGAV
jgi:hypothetical protein